MWRCSRKVRCFVGRMWAKVWVRVFGENHPLVRGHDGTIGSGGEVSDHKPPFGGEVGKVISCQPLEIIRRNINGFADRQICQRRSKCFESFWRYDLHTAYNSFAGG